MSVKFPREECFTDFFIFFNVCIYVTWVTSNIGLFLFLCNSVRDGRFKFNAENFLETSKCDYSNCRKYNYKCLMAHKQGRQVYAVDKVVWDDYKACSISECLKDGNTASCLACSLFQISVWVSAGSVLHFRLLCCHRAIKSNVQSVLLVNRDQLTNLPPSGQPWASLP